MSFKTVKYREQPYDIKIYTGGRLTYEQTIYADVPINTWHSFKAGLFTILDIEHETIRIKSVHYDKSADPLKHINYRIDI